MSVSDYRCATYGCNEDAVSVYSTSVGAVYGACAEHQPIADVRWIHAPSEWTCGARSFGVPHACERPEGHRGKHATYGMGGNVMTWEDLPRVRRRLVTA